MNATTQFDASDNPRGGIRRDTRGRRGGTTTLTNERAENSNVNVQRVSTSRSRLF